MHDDDATPPDPHAQWKLGLARGLFAVRWLQLPFLVGLVLSLFLFVAVFFQRLYQLFGLTVAGDRLAAILAILDLLDMMLIANLLVVFVMSAFKTLLLPTKLGPGLMLPEWIEALTLANVKFRVAGTILLISTIHILHQILDPHIDSAIGAILLLSAQLVLVITTWIFASVEKAGSH